jgi:hypothetical protein
VGAQAAGGIKESGETWVNVSLDDIESTFESPSQFSNLTRPDVCVVAARADEIADDEGTCHRHTY